MNSGNSPAGFVHGQIYSRAPGEDSWIPSLGFCHPSRQPFRVLLLVLVGLLNFASFLSSDIPSVLQRKLELDKVVDSDGVNLSPLQYNSLYAVFAWGNALTILISGTLFTRLGTRRLTLVFSLLTVASGAGLTYGMERRSWLILLVARFVLGCCIGTLSVSQNELSLFWFEGIAQAVVLGLTLGFSRFASVLNFVFMPGLIEEYGLDSTLWGVTSVCGITFLFAVIVCAMDAHGISKFSRSASTLCERVSVKAIRSLPASYWLLCLTTAFFYNAVFPFIADATYFISTKYELSTKDASLNVGVVYIISLILAPFMSGIISKTGHCALVTVLACAIGCPAFVLFAFTRVSPLVSTVLLGLAYSTAAASLSLSLRLIVPVRLAGTAICIMTVLTMVANGCSSIVVGLLRQHNDSNDATRAKALGEWRNIMFFFLANMGLSLLLAVVLLLVDRANSNVLGGPVPRTELLASHRGSLPADMAHEPLLQPSPPSPRKPHAQLAARPVVSSHSAPRR